MAVNVLTYPEPLGPHRPVAGYHFFTLFFFAKLRKATILPRHVCPSVRLSAWNAFVF